MRPLSYPVTNGFGVKNQIYTNLGMLGHNGWDFAAPLGTAVRAPESGTAVATVDSTGYGKLITITGKSGWTHKLAHLQKYGKTGSVNEGDVVGYVNSTGLSTGHHLHWGTRPKNYNSKNGYLGYVHPQTFLSAVTSTQGTYMGVSAKAWSAEAVRGFIYEVTGNRHTLADINKHHVGKSRGKIYDQFFPSREYKTALNNWYRVAYNRPATDAEYRAKVNARDGIPKVKDQLLASLGK